MPYINEYQRIACQKYPQADLLPFDVDNSEEVRIAIDEDATGDTLFNFVYYEMGDLGNNGTLEDAVDALRHAQDDLQRVIDALEAEAPDAL